MQSLKKCPICNAPMIPQEERYDLTATYVDRWWECIECGYCIDRNFEVEDQDDGN